MHSTQLRLVVDRVKPITSHSQESMDSQQSKILCHLPYICLLYYDVVDGNVDEFDKKPNESHDGKTNGCSKGYFLKF